MPEATIRIVVGEDRVQITVESDTGPEHSPATAIAVLMAEDAKAKLDKLLPAFDAMVEASEEEAADLLARLMGGGKNG